MCCDEQRLSVRSVCNSTKRALLHFRVSLVAFHDSKNYMIYITYSRLENFPRSPRKEVERKRPMFVCVKTFHLSPQFEPLQNPAQLPFLSPTTSLTHFARQSRHCTWGKRKGRQKVVFSDLKKCECYLWSP